MRQLSLNKQTAQGHRACRVCGRWTWTQACAMAYRAIPTMLCGCHCQGYLWQPHLPIEGLLAWILQCFCGSLLHFTLWNRWWYTCFHQVAMELSGCPRSWGRVLAGSVFLGVWVHCFVPFSTTTFKTADCTPRNTVILSQFSIISLNMHWNFTLGRYSGTHQQ